MTQLGYRINSIDSAELVPNLFLFPNGRGSPKYLGDTSKLGITDDKIKSEHLYHDYFSGIASGLTRYTPTSLEDVQEWEIISRSLYSHKDLNPRKRVGSTLKEGIGDSVREVSK